MTIPVDADSIPASDIVLAVTRYGGSHSRVLSKHRHRYAKIPLDYFDAFDTLVRAVQEFWTLGYPQVPEFVTFDEDSSMIWQLDRCKSHKPKLISVAWNFSRHAKH